MNCRKARAILARDFESSLSPEAKGSFEAHLAACGACRREMEAEKELSTLLRSRPVEHPPEAYWNSFWPRVRARLEPIRRPVFRPVFAPAWRRVFTISFAAAALALAIIGGDILFTGKATRKLEEAARSPARSEANVDYVIARADRARQTPESHFVLARGRTLPAASSIPAGHAAPVIPASPSFRHVLASVTNGYEQLLTVTNSY
ncbi:MAG: zf-HC2 domain-containing protein [Candidatus Aureabacteria bacterium]|nr:zf-HC2 domain-containing protein [Candidatus Auribacterota bacterium]